MRGNNERTKLKFSWVFLIHKWIVLIKYFNTKFNYLLNLCIFVFYYMKWPHSVRWWSKRQSVHSWIKFSIFRISFFLGNLNSLTRLIKLSLIIKENYFVCIKHNSNPFQTVSEFVSINLLFSKYITHAVSRIGKFMYPVKHQCINSCN